MTETAADRAPARPAAVWEDFIDVFTSPSAVFDRRRDGAYAGGLALLGVVAALAFAATHSFWQPYFEHQFELGVAAQQAAGKLTAEQAQQAAGAVGKFTEIATWVGGLVGTPLTVMIVALIVQGAARVVGARLTYGQALVAATMAFVPRVLETLVSAGVLATKDPASYASGAYPASPAALLGPSASQFAVAILNRLDPFVLWGTVLLGIGVAVLGRVDRRKGLGAAAMVWGVATLFALVSAARNVAAAS